MLIDEADFFAVLQLVEGAEIVKAKWVSAVCAAPNRSGGNRVFQPCASCGRDARADLAWVAAGRVQAWGAGLERPSEEGEAGCELINPGGAFHKNAHDGFLAGSVSGLGFISCHAEQSSLRERG